MRKSTQIYLISAIFSVLLFGALLIGGSWAESNLDFARTYSGRRSLGGSMVISLLALFFIFSFTLPPLLWRSVMFVNAALGATKYAFFNKLLHYEKPIIRTFQGIIIIVLVLPAAAVFMLWGNTIFDMLQR